MRTNPAARALAAGALVAAIGTAACTGPEAASQTSRVERGKYLVTIGGCNDCHTPLKRGPKGPEPDMARMLSGHPESFEISTGTTPASAQWMMTAAVTGTAFSGPWGVSFAANLTPDQNTGLGIWTEDMFIRTIRTGKHMGVSRDILPPMPWPMYRNATDEDLKSIYAFLRSIRPVHNRVPTPLPPVEQTAENHAPEAITASAQ
jgi:mono/diheme cytochrome c family protein